MGSLFARYRSLSLGVRILIWMAIGIVVGLLLGPRAAAVAFIGELFIRLLLMAAIPLVFFNLLAGITSLTDGRMLGRVGLKTILFYFSTTAAAMTLGLTMAHIIRPGVGIDVTAEANSDIGTVPRVVDVILDLVPKNVFAAFAEGKVSQVVVFAVFLGVAALGLPSDRRERFAAGCDLIADTLRRVVELLLQTAPLGVGALAAATVGEYGASVFGSLGKFIAAVWGAQAMMAIFYLSVLYGLTKRNPIQWLKTTSPLYATTASTCSSLASLVVALEVARERLKLKESIYSFTLPLGAQLNKDGTSIMLAVVLIFTAQAVGIDFSIGSQITILLVGLLLCEGSGGIPGGGLVIAMIFVKAFELPLEIASLVAGIYRLIDMGSTTINCMGDMAWTTILSDSHSDHVAQPGMQGSNDG